MTTLMSGATTFSTTTLVRMTLCLAIATLSKKKTVALNNEFKNVVIKSGMSHIWYHYGIL